MQGRVELRNFRRRVFDPAARSAGLDGLTPHEFAAHGREPGRERRGECESGSADARARAAAMTLDVYSGLFDDDLDGVADRMDAAAARAVEPPVCPETAVIPITRSETAV